MDKSSSKLSGTGCDFVVATTQASINSSLLEYLAEGSQPMEYICYLADEKGNPTLEIGRDQLLEKTGGIDPFDIDADTPYDDPQITAVTKARFMVGIRMQLGLPPGVNPRDLSVVTLVGDRPDRVLFNMYCSQVTVIQNSPPGGWGNPGSWNVWNQPYGQPWVAQAEVNLVVADLDHNLDSSSYLNNHPAVKDELRKALVNLSGTAFSLQQLLFDLDNAALQGDPQFPGMDMSKDAGYILQMYFVKRYQQSAKEHGLPLIAVTAASQDSDPSPLQMTSLERTLTHPTGSSSPATTLNYLCAVDNHPTPSPYTRFDWNWVQPAEISESSGVIAIRREIFADLIAQSLQDAVNRSCFTANVESYGCSVSADGNRPPPSVSPSGSHLISLVWESLQAGTMYPMRDSYPVDTTLGVFYTLDAYLDEDSINVAQWLKVNASCAAVALEGGITGHVNVNVDLVKKSMTDTYNLTVTQDGGLRLVRAGGSGMKDESDPIPVPDWNPKAWQLVLAALHKIQDAVSLDGGDLHELEVSKVQSFVFPGARVFTYKRPTFSQYQDLLFEITYVDPTEVSASPQRPDPSPATKSIHPDPMKLATGKLTVSAELIQNYVQGEIISPTGKFEALQTGDGHTLLFGIDSSGVLQVIEEQSGTCHVGWHVHDLSTAAIQAQFMSDASRAVVRTFDVGQNALDGTIGLMMAVHLDGNDHLFHCLNNPNQDLSWTACPAWTMVPFDPANETTRAITIAGAMFAETWEKSQFLVVDVERTHSQSASEAQIVRYHIDTAHTTGHFWVKKDVTIDLATGAYQSVVGRVRGKPVDGIYNAGTTGGQPQLVYEPVINAYGDGPVTPRRLRLPGGAIPTAIATARNAADHSTDLYCVGGSTLYRFAADQQSEAKDPLALCTSEFLVGTDTLRAMTHGGMTTLWGRNQSDQVYYLACRTSQLSKPAAWSMPFPILSGIERISAYVNCADGGRTIFAAGNGRLQKIVQGSPATGGVWRAQDITVTAAPSQPCTSFRSYTTTIHVTELTSNAPVPKAMVKLSASSRTPVFINGLYYVLSATVPVQVPADPSGVLTVIEATNDSLQAAVLTVGLENTTLTINPTDQTMARITALDSADKLRGAQVPTQTIAGGVDGASTYTSLVSPSAADDDVAAVAQSMGVLKDAYAKVQVPAQTTMTLNLNFFGDLWDGIGAIVGDIKEILGSIGDALSAAWGDTWQWLKNAGKTLGRIVVDAATGAMHFLAKIGGQIFHAALNTVHAVAGAIGWLVDKIKDAATSLVDWALVLLDWGDIRRTKQVAHNLIRLWMQHQVDQIPQVAARWDQAITGLEQTIDQWSGASDFAPLGADGEVMKKPGAQGAANPNQGQTSASQLFVTHYRNHAHQLTVVGDSPSLDGVEGLLEDLLAAISKEGAVLGTVFDQLQQLLDDFSSISLEEVLKRMMGILADGVMSSVQVVGDTLLRILQTLTQSALAVLDTKIHIPIISDLLNLVGVPDISFLDLFTWIIAVAYTIVYKITHNKRAPFPDTTSVSALIAAGSWEELCSLFGHSQLAVSSDLQQMIFAPGHALAGLAGVILGSVSTFEAECETGSNPFSWPGIVLAITSAALQGATNFLAPHDPIANEVVSDSTWGLLAIRIASKVFFAVKGPSEPVAPANVGKLVMSNARGVSAIVDTVLILPDIAITGWHIGELAQKPAGKVKSAAILEECGKVASWISRAAYAIALNDPEPDSKEIAVGLTGMAIWVAAGFQLGEAEWC
ncbi:hypothetical protein BO86DRAFT_434744 [Aspergillus japonicus CBS 114.51]|uniref:Uncharacterized protein n=1 Tax=Aspergillus japonicus CBS 114.51 TaxID=1448312 RepID=A0A8T8XDB2_ASPJA|nr:hypothetical protein BO86DRAFT_434744 [Aspergillus japonicus CBS 114.51]RAH86125.1 hypothetical protein BO86DRAFT_434744 [Aspergillus japonicus CBS 114.51]